MRRQEVLEVYARSHGGGHMRYIVAVETVRGVIPHISMRVEVEYAKTQRSAEQQAVRTLAYSNGLMEKQVKVTEIYKA